MYVTYGKMSAMCEAHRKGGVKYEWGTESVERNQKKIERKKERKGKEKERKRKRGKSVSFFSRSLTFRRLELVRPRSKVRLLDEGYTPRGSDSSYFGYFHPKGCLVVFSSLRGCFF